MCNGLSGNYYYWIIFSLPEIVQSLKCQESLYTALKGVLEEWKVKGSNFWIVRDVAAEKENDLVTRIKKLQNERCV